MKVEYVKMEAIKSKKLNATKVHQWMGKYWASGERPCVICQENSWSVSAEPVEVKTFRLGKYTSGGAIEIFMVITCEICGNSHLVNTLAADLMEMQE